MLYLNNESFYKFFATVMHCCFTDWSNYFPPCFNYGYMWLGWAGVNCSHESCERLNPCVNGATCKDTNDWYTCSCTPGYTGTNCSDNINDCQSSSCQFGNCTDYVDYYNCTCIPGEPTRADSFFIADLEMWQCQLMWWNDWVWYCRAVNTYCRLNNKI